MEINSIVSNENISKKFLLEVEYLSNASNWVQFEEAFFLPLERELGKDRSMYKNRTTLTTMFKRTVERLIGKTTDDELAKSIIRQYMESPLGIFNFVINKSGSSDIFVTDAGVSYTTLNSDLPYNIIIPDIVKPTYRKLVDKFILLNLYASKTDKTKFDRSNAVLDFDSFNIRFNVVHGSLNANIERPIVSLRRQAARSEASINNRGILGENYINSLGLTENQKNFINEIATNGSFIIFGETGSGKTTLLKYMGAHNIELKRNLITIEDTAELFLPVNIAYLTSDKYDINSIFKVTLRENPSHMLIGETRSEEIVSILQSALVLKIGSTLHADSFRKVLARILFLAKSVDNNYTSEDINALILATMDCFIYMKERKLVEIWKRKDKNETKGLSVNDLSYFYELVE